MSKGVVHVSNASELQGAIDGRAAHIIVTGELSGMPMITLAPGQRLSGGTLRFGACGVRLTQDNVLEDITIVSPAHERAVLTDTSIADWGTLTLRNVRTEGQVMLCAQDATRGGRVIVDGLHVAVADLRGRELRPHGFGVDVLQGAFTLWNRQESGELTAELNRISAGSKESPVRGSGVFVAGHGDWHGKSRGGTLRVSQLTTGEIHVDGGIPPGTPDLISGGVFVVYSAIVDEVENVGPVTTYGPNDMVLDNWGAVTRWIARAPITSYGPSGIGFVQFADVRTLHVAAPIETHGAGARGFNLYDGTIGEARFESITTHADAGAGIQISRAMGKITIDGDVRTTGSRGDSLVKGHVISLAACGISIQPNGVLDELEVGGSLVTEGNDVTTLQVQGEVHHVRIGGQVVARGRGSHPLVVDGGRIDVDQIRDRLVPAA
jgi:hypothetical protein